VVDFGHHFFGHSLLLSTTVLNDRVKLTDQNWFAQSNTEIGRKMLIIGCYHKL